MKVKMSPIFIGRCSTCKSVAKVFDVYDDVSRQTEAVCEKCSVSMDIAKIKMSAVFEGKCDVCGNVKNVVTFGDEDTRKAATVCSECANKTGVTSQKDLVEKYGKVDEEPFKKGVRFEPGGKAS